MFPTSMSFFILQGRKDVVAIFNNLLRRQIRTRNPTEEYINQHSNVLILLVKG